jgi:hypothetical protein
MIFACLHCLGTGISSCRKDLARGGNPRLAPDQPLWSPETAVREECLNPPEQTLRYASCLHPLEQTFFAHSVVGSFDIEARKQRSAEQALLLLQEQIYTAWRGRRVLSLISFVLARARVLARRTAVSGLQSGWSGASRGFPPRVRLISFDVKGAYNGVCKERLLQRMKARGIPEGLLRIWMFAVRSEQNASTHRSRPSGMPRAFILWSKRSLTGIEPDQLRCQRSLQRSVQRTFAPKDEGTRHTGRHAV